MDKYKIERTKEGKYIVKTRDYFWQRWHQVTDPEGNPIEKDTIEQILKKVGSAWWKEFWIKVNSIGVF